MKIGTWSFIGFLISQTFLMSGCRYWDRFVQRTSPGDKTLPGVTFYDPTRIMDGVNIVNPGWMDRCTILDMEGKTLGTLPGGFCLFLPNGQYFSNRPGPSLYDSEFKLIWSLPEIKQHHEAVYDVDRDWIWILTYEYGAIQDKKIEWDCVLGLDRKTGEVKFRWRFDESLPDIEKAVGRKLKVYSLAPHQSWVIGHLNSIDIVPAHQKGVGQAGDLLLTDAGSAGALYILNIQTKKISWIWSAGIEGFNWLQVHSAHYFPSGEIVFFVNRQSSEISDKYGFKQSSFLARIQSDTKKVVWTYVANPPGNFFSDPYGNVQPLENGNYLVTHNPQKVGAAFEVTPEGRVVWEWGNNLPARSQDDLEIYRVTRVKRSIVEPYLRAWENSTGNRAERP